MDAMSHPSEEGNSKTEITRHFIDSSQETEHESSASTSPVVPSMASLPWVSGGLQVLLALCFVASLVLNAVLVIVFLRRRGFRSKISNRFLMNLVAANLFAALTTTAPVILEHHWHCSATLRAVTDALMCAAAAASILAQLLVGSDQFLAVTDPLNYEDRVSHKRCLLFCAAAWAVSVAVGVVVGVDGAGLLHATDDKGLSVPTSAVLFGAVFGLPSLALTYIYTRVFLAARSNSVRTRRNSVGSATLSSGDNYSDASLHGHFFYQAQQQQQQQLDTSLKQTVQTKTRRGDVCVHPGDRLSALKRTQTRLSILANASMSSLSQFGETAAATLRRHQEETHAAKVTLVVVVTLLACWTPYFVSLLLATLRVAAAADFRLASLALAALSPVLTPLLYAYRSPRIRRDIRRALGMISVSRRRELYHPRRQQHYSKRMALPSVSALRSPIIDEEAEQDRSPVRFQLGGGSVAHKSDSSSSLMGCPHLLVSQRKHSTSKPFPAPPTKCCGGDDESNPMLLATTAAVAVAVSPLATSGRSSISSAASSGAATQSSGATTDVSVIVSSADEEERESMNTYH